MTNDERKMVSILVEAGSIAVVGLSPKPDRPSYEVAVYLMNEGYEIIPVNPQHTEILGMKTFNSVSSIDRNVDLVVVFRKPEEVPEVTRDILLTSAKCIWLQQGIRSDEAASAAEDRGLSIYQDICIKQTHQRLFNSKCHKTS